ncbi:hypothetical protein EDB84DRAFT_1567416 [Lactarius hengduanensis]|nr:hypothetical protein EDB84DRAFT_1567416 [Lactarius hengduanensis]
MSVTLPCACNPVSDKPRTPPNHPAPLFLSDPNVTPTPVRVKRTRTEDLPPSSPFTYPPPLTHLENMKEAVLWTSSSPKHARQAPLPPPTPMEEDFDYALEVWAEATEAKNGGLRDSVHAPAPIVQPSPLPAHNPSAPPQVAALAAQAEQPTTAPIPAALEHRPTGLADPSPAPTTAAPEDGLARLIAALNATITRLDAKLDAGLDAQNKRIDALFQSRDPRPKPAKAQSAKAKEAVAAPPAPNTAKAPGPPTMDETLSRMARVDDPVGEPIAELFTEGASAAPHHEPIVTREAFQPPADRLIRLETDARGKPVPTATMPVSWAGKHQPDHGPHGRRQSRPETAARRTASANTDVTVIRGHGVEDPMFELQLFKRAPSTFVAEIRQEIERMSQGKLIILSARWSQKANAHNFVYTFQGDVPFTQVFPYRHLLVKPLLAGYVVPNDGWTHAQLRDVSTRAPDGTIYDNDALMAELCRNTPFKDAIFCLVPHWQGSAFTVAHSEKTTVSMAFVDEHGSVSSAAVAAGTFMFNARARLIITGDSPSIVMCGRCHRIGHATNTPACPLPANGVRCVRCGGAHHSDDHVTFCTGYHPTAGICTCIYKCLNCSGKHGTRSAACPMKKGFAPPPMVAREDPTIATLPAPSAKGKSKSVAPPPPEDLIPTQREPASGSAAKASAAAHFAPPPFPDWKEVPIIGLPHVATATETFEAIKRITANSTDASRNDDLAVVCGEWKKEVMDDDPYGYTDLVHPIPGKPMAAARDALLDFDNKWGDVSPFYFTLGKLDTDHDQSFILPGRSWNLPLTRHLRRSESSAATALLSSCIAVQEFSHPGDYIPISADTVNFVARTYTTANFLKYSQDDLWTIVKDNQLSINASTSMPHA